MSNNPRCLYVQSFDGFLRSTEMSIFGELCDRYHGEARTTTRDAWKGEIAIMQDVLSRLGDRDGHIIFEYDIPRLGKRIDVVLLLKGIIFCIEFKVGESRILEADIDQVLDYALDLKNFHKFSEDKVIAPILVATNYNDASSQIRISPYNDRVVNPLMTGQAGLLDLITKVLNRFPYETPVNPKAASYQKNFGAVLFFNLLNYLRRYRTAHFPIFC